MPTFTDPMARRLGRVVGRGLPHDQRARTLIYGFIIFGAVASILVCDSLHYEHQRAQVEHQRRQMTSLERAYDDNSRQDYAGALQDLSEIAPSSPDYAAAQEFKQAIEHQRLVRARKAVMRAHTSQAEDSCKKVVEQNEEFPSTVSYSLFGFGTTSQVSDDTIVVKVDYTAKNSTGADLPYTMSCFADQNGEITFHQRTGR